MWLSYTRHNVEKPRLSITKSHDEGTFVLLSLQTIQLQLCTGVVTRLLEQYRDKLWAKDRLGAINLPVRICLHHTPINTGKGYHASNFMIIRIKHNPTILHLGVAVINMERATQDGYITHRSKQEKIIMHQPSWSYAPSITQPSWRCSSSI